MSSEPHQHKWKFKQLPHGLRRSCHCGAKIMEIASPKGSFLEDHPELKELRKKGKHYRNKS